MYLYGEYLRIGPGAETGDGLRDPDRRAAGQREGAVHVPAAPVPRCAASRVYVGGKRQTHVDGAPRDENAFAGVSFDLHSGDGLSVTHVRGSIDLDWGFDVAGVVPVAPGHYDLVDTELALYTSGNRPLSASGTASFQRIWDGDDRRRSAAA